MTFLKWCVIFWMLISAVALAGHAVTAGLWVSLTCLGAASGFAAAAVLLGRLWFDDLLVGKR